jgi:hypothetical protein
MPPPTLGLVKAFPRLVMQVPSVMTLECNGRGGIHMADQTEDTLTMILVSNVLILARQLKAEAEARGSHRVGGDYTKEAAKMIFDQRVNVFQALRQR